MNRPLLSVAQERKGRKETKIVLKFQNLFVSAFTLRSSRPCGSMVSGFCPAIAAFEVVSA